MRRAIATCAWLSHVTAASTTSLRRVSTCDLCDEFPAKLQILDPALNLRSFGGAAAFHGPAVTVACFEDNSRVKELAATPGENRVMVVDGGASLRRALLGDMIAENAMRNGWAGFVINGCVRDVEVLRTLSALGVKALNAVPLKTDRRGLGDVNVPVSFGGVRFAPGCWVYADETGVVVSGEELRAAK